MNKFSLTSFIFFLDKEPDLKASRTSLSTRKLACVYVQQGTLYKGIFVYILNSCGLIKVVKNHLDIVAFQLSDFLIYSLVYIIDTNI